MATGLDEGMGGRGVPPADPEFDWKARAPIVAK
jgi:hypothetical protein